MLEDVALENLGATEKGDWVSIRGTVTFIKKERGADSPPWYFACVTDGCQKKVTEEGSAFRCEVHGPAPTKQNRYILSATIADHTGHHWVTFFNDEAQQLLGKDADEMGALRDHNPSAYLSVFDAALFKQGLFRVRFSRDEYQGETRVRATVNKFYPLDFKREANALFRLIEAYGA
jgi:replication factor A1